MEYFILAVKIISIIGVIFLMGENLYLRQEFNKLKKSYDKIVGIDKAGNERDYTAFSISKLDEMERTNTLSEQISDKIAQNIAKDIDRRLLSVLIQLKYHVESLPQGEGIIGAVNIINTYIKLIKK